MFKACKSEIESLTNHGARILVPVTMRNGGISQPVPFTHSIADYNSLLLGHLR